MGSRWAGSRLKVALQGPLVAVCRDLLPGSRCCRQKHPHRGAHAGFMKDTDQGWLSFSVYKQSFGFLQSQIRLHFLLQFLLRLLILKSLHIHSP